MNHIGNTFKQWRLVAIPVCLAGMFALGCVWGERNIPGRMAELEADLQQAREREEEAVAVRRVSKQMEEIAYQQKELSDRQRQNAETQAAENLRMKQRVEQEWQHAVAARQEAEKAYRLADSQKELAEARQAQAEHAKRVADTLTYLILGRSLGSLAVTQYHTGNRETASLLAYAAWRYTQRYGGDEYSTSVFQSLSLSSGQPNAWQCHQEGVSRIVWGKGDTFYTTGRYGEVLQWEADTQNGYRCRSLYANPQQDFRDACIGDDGALYALSHEGELLRFSEGSYQSQTLPVKGCLQMVAMKGGWWLLTLAGEIHTSATRQALPVTGATCMAKDGTDVLVGRANGELLHCQEAGGITPLGCPHPAPVTAIADCGKDAQIAIGYADGTLLLADRRGNVRQRLVGHRSAVTGILFHDGRLYTCSNDRSLRLWDLKKGRIEPLVALESSSWLQAMALAPDGKSLFGGDGNGTLYRLSVSPDEMAATVRKHLTRNFTPEEWQYYIGNGIPYETYITPTP